MGKVYSTSFIQAHAGTIAYYTVPSGYKAVIRCITFFNASALSPESCSVFLYLSNATIWAAFVNPISLGEPGNRESSALRVVVEEGDEIRYTLDTDCDLTVNGYLLELP